VIGRIMVRLMALAALLWAIGFALFAVTLPRPADNRHTDAIVVLTGAPGRIARGLTVLKAGAARRMLISGVDPAVRPHELAIAQKMPLRLLACCVDLGREAVDTRSNGVETAAWLRRHHYRSVRLVTSDWHMNRARFELEQVLGRDVTITADAVTGDASFSALFMEYQKYSARRAAVLIGL
jgi:uncharacterized SAM-binding protein YcdF (DUF218 family)